MSNSNNVIELKTVKTHVISPKIFYQDISNLDNDKSYDGSRINILCRLHGMLEFDQDLPYDKGITFVSHLK